MINHRIATLTELLEELQNTKEVLGSSLENIAQIFKDLESRYQQNDKAQTLLRYYYEQHSISKVLIDAAETITVIGNLLSETKIQKGHVEQLKDIASSERRAGLVKFKDDWLEEVHTESYSDLYKAAIHIDDLIVECKNTASYLKNYEGESNPLTAPRKSPTCEINGKNIFIDGIDSGIRLTPAPANIFIKLTKIGEDGRYLRVKTGLLRGKKSDDAFRTNLRRLRKEVGSAFRIENDTTDSGESAYKLYYTL